MFFRPAGLKGSAGEAPAQIIWRVVKTDKGAALEAHNPTPYHVSFAALDLTGDGKTAKFDDGGMVGPGETQDFPLSGEAFQGADAKLRYHAINDYGGPADGEAVLNAAPPVK
jgi:fimbrial chaperone protein/chaperone protein EcpD